MTLLVLVLTASSQIYDSNFLYLWPAAAMIEGDSLYREVFDSGVPLAAYLSSIVQRVVGYRLIGEFGLHWVFIVAGTVVAFALGRRLCRSRVALSAMFAAAMLVLANTSTYHYPKLFFFPAIIALAWRYLDRPSVPRVAALGAVSAIAFLFRHDFGMYTGFACVLAVTLGRVVVPASRDARGLVRDAVTGVLAVLVVLVPWALIVESREGLAEYFQTRSALYFGLQGSLWNAIWLNLNPVARIISLAGQVPSAADAAVLLVQEIALLVPIGLLVAAVRRVWRHRDDLTAVAPDTWHLMLAGAFLLFADLMLFRQPSYVAVVAPISAALGARFLVTAHVVTRAVAMGLVIVAAAATLVWARESPIFHPATLPKYVAQASGQLLASPPIPAESSGAPSPLLRYLRDCSAPDDRLLVTGSTPFQVNYYARRRIAGGHVFWHYAWRSDPVHEQQSLDMIKAAPVPFAVSSTDPLLEEFARYPKIRAYLVEHYRELEGTRGRLFVDRRRQATGTFSDLGWPCYR